MRAIFIRHGESTGNAGVPCHDLAAIELTERGHEQARQVAASWTQAPALIVTSPYTRTRQTAAPTIARSEEHTSELQSLMRISYAVFCLKKKTNKQYNTTPRRQYTKKPH